MIQLSTFPFSPSSSDTQRQGASQPFQLLSFGHGRHREQHDVILNRVAKGKKQGNGLRQQVWKVFFSLEALPALLLAGGLVATDLFHEQLEQLGDFLPFLASGLLILHIPGHLASLGLMANAASKQEHENTLIDVNEKLSGMGLIIEPTEAGLRIKRLRKKPIKPPLKKMA